MNWRFKSSDRPSRVEDNAGFRPNRRFLRLESAGSGWQRQSVTRRGSRLRSRLKQGVRVIIVPVLLVSVGWLAWQQVPRLSLIRYFQISNLLVEGNHRVPTATIIRGLGLASDASILGVDLRALATIVARNPWIKTAWISRRLPATLQVHVSERTAYAVVVADRAYLVSEDGLILQEASSVDMSDLPLLRLHADHPFEAGERIDSARVEQGAHLWKRFHQGALGPDILAREVELKGDGSYTVVLDRGLPSLYFGNEEDVQQQLERLTRVLALRRTALHELEYADFRFADKVIVKPRSKEGA